MAFKGAQSFNQNLANWDISKATQFYNMFEDTNSFNFKLELDVAWEAKNSNAYPWENMFDGSCYNDPDCGKCGMKQTGGDDFVNIRGSPTGT